MSGNDVSLEERVTNLENRLSYVFGLLEDRGYLDAY